MTHKSLPLIPLGVVLQLLVGPLSRSILVGKSLSLFLHGISSRLWIVTSVLPQSVSSMITIKGISFKKGESSLESSEFPSLPLSFRDFFMTRRLVWLPGKRLSPYLSLLRAPSRSIKALSHIRWSRVCPLMGADDVPILVCYPLLTMIRPKSRALPLGASLCRRGSLLSRILSSLP